MKKIRLVDQREIEVYNITESGNTLEVEILNGDSNEAEKLFSNSDNLATIQYYVGTDLMKGYAGFTKLRKYQKRIGQTISVNYEKPDVATESGFAEEKADVLTVTMEKPTKLEIVQSETEQLRADVDYLYMESGVSV